MITLPLDLVDPAGTWKRLSKRLTTTDPAQCWEWTGATDDRSGGYGVMAVKCHTGGSRWGWRAAKPHRVSWTIHRGPIPEGLVIDHTACGNRVCCNPDHLEVVTQAENARRSAVPAAAVCRRCGGTDWIMRGKQRKCRPCWNDYFRQWQRDQRPTVVCPECGTEFQRTTATMACCSRGCQIERRKRGRREWMREYSRRKRHETPNIS